MCSRYRLSADKAAIAMTFGLAVAEDLTLPGRELFPKRLGVVLRRGAAALVTDVLSWGLTGPSVATLPVTNVSMLGCPHWRNLLRDPAHRCLVPVSTFCQWSGKKGARVENWFSLRDRQLFAFAGLYRLGENVTGTYGLLTCEANPPSDGVQSIAMPVILHAYDHDRWLDGDLDDVRELATPFPSQLMTIAS